VNDNAKDNTKKAHDLFGLSDINRIQAEIERDLAESSAPRVSSESETPMGSAPTERILTFEAPTEGSSVVPSEVSLEVPSEATGFAASANSMMIDSTAQPVPGSPLPADVSAGFYREMIKDPPRRSSSSWLKTAIVVLLICTLGTGTLGFGMGAGWSFIRGNSDNGVNGEARANTSEAVPLTSTSYRFESIISETEVGTVADIVELLVPSVVGITTRRTEERRSRIVPFPPPATSVASGIIFAECEERIFIATNYYVVRFGCYFEVSIAGNEPIYARPVGGDSYADLAVLSVYKSQLIEAGIDTIVIAAFGDSGEMRFGDAVLALGNAMGDGTSVTGGVISSPQRYMEFPNREPLMILQTDAAINYGSSGGPLINARGEVIGINISQATTSIFGSSPVEGMGYSIASNMAAPILLEIAFAPPRAGIGIRGGSVTEAQAYELGILAMGVWVSEVTEGLGAYRAGMLPNDVITGFNGLPIFDFNQLVEAIRAGRVGDVMEVRVIRNSTDVVTLWVELSQLIIEFN